MAISIIALGCEFPFVECCCVSLTSCLFASSAASKILTFHVLTRCRNADIAVTYRSQVRPLSGLNVAPSEALRIATPQCLEAIVGPPLCFRAAIADGSAFSQRC